MRAGYLTSLLKSSPSIKSQNLSRQMFPFRDSVTFVWIHLFECLCTARVDYYLEMTFFFANCFHGCLGTLLSKSFHHSAIVMKAKTWSNWWNLLEALFMWLPCEMFSIGSCVWLLAVAAIWMVVVSLRDEACWKKWGTVWGH